MHVNGFTYGALTPALAYIMSFIGSTLGLQSASRARATVGAARYRWMALSATSIGGTGIWVMHFIAMLGFSVPGVDIRYDAAETLASMVVAIAVVGLGLAIVVPRPHNIGALLLGGLVTGSGVAAMHYLGMAAMRMAPAQHYDNPIVALSEGIAATAATAALWAALNIRGLPATIGAAAIMGVAVTGMHYTGMAALHVGSVDPNVLANMADGMGGGPTDGLTASQLLAPLTIGISVTTTIILLIVAMAPTERELRAEARAAELAESIRSR